MKIAINLTRDNVGGITSANINLINYLYKLDYEFIGLELITRMYMKGPALFRYFSPEIFDHHILNIHHLPILNVLKRNDTIKDVAKAYKEPIKIIRNILKEAKPDVVLINGTQHLQWLISLAARKEKIPIVLWYAGVLTKETEHCRGGVKKKFAAIEKAIVKNSAKIIFPSELCKKTVEQLVLKKRIKKSWVIPNPVAGAFTEPSVVGPATERRLAAVGRYSKIKNFDKFFELHLELKKRRWQHTASFVTNPDASPEKMPKTIELLPSMTAEALKKFYLTQGLIVCPSVFETFGNVPMEAACLGVPVLVNDTMGCAEVLKKVGLANMVMPFDDISKVADRAQELCGQIIMPTQLNALKKILDTNFVSEQIRIVLNHFDAKKNGRKQAA